MKSWRRLCLMAGVFPVAVLLALLSSHKLMAMPPDWESRHAMLCDKLFTGKSGKITTRLLLAEDGFFVLTIKSGQDEKQPTQTLTGQWRLEQDAITLLLANRHDTSIRATVGTERIYLSLASIYKSARTGERIVLKATPESMSFELAGILKNRQFYDPASGCVFPLSHTVLMDLSDHGDSSRAWFGTASLKAAPVHSTLQITIENIRNLSKQIPRFIGYATINSEEQQLQSSANIYFAKDVAGFFWLRNLSPPVNLYFEPPQDGKGAFEISGQGLRCEGTYLQKGNKLTMQITPRDLRMLKLTGQEKTALSGDFTWHVYGKTLELMPANGKKIILYHP